MESLVFKKSKKFAIKIVNLCNQIQKEQKEFNISNQLFRSGTSIGANIAESVYAASKADFANKLKIALKEASEARYWIWLLFSTNYINSNLYEEMTEDVNEIIKMLTSSIKNSITQEDDI